MLKSTSISLHSLTVYDLIPGPQLLCKRHHGAVAMHGMAAGWDCWGDIGGMVLMWGSIMDA